MLTIGYVANGKSTNRYHLPFVLLRENIKVKTIFSPNVHDSVWEKKENIIYTDNVEELMNDQDIDVIVVCTTQQYHYEYAKMALDHGKNVLVEKPFMMTSEEAKEIFAYAKKKGLTVQCYQNRRYDSDFLTVQKVIESGKLGEIYEVEMNFDYYRPEIPENVNEFTFYNSFLYTHACHTLDQVISYFGKPDKIHYDVRQLLGKGRMNDYFDLDLYYNSLKVSVRSSYYRIKERPSFVVFGKKGKFIKQTKDRQEEHLKLFYMPGQPQFGEDNIEHYGTITYQDDHGVIREEKVVSEVGDYGRVYDDLYNFLVLGKPQVIKEEQTLLQMQILETGIQMCQE